MKLFILSCIRLCQSSPYLTEDIAIAKDTAGSDSTKPVEAQLTITALHTRSPCSGINTSAATANLSYPHCRLCHYTCEHEFSVWLGNFLHHFPKLRPEVLGNVAVPNKITSDEQISLATRLQSQQIIGIFTRFLNMFKTNIYSVNASETIIVMYITLTYIFIYTHSYTHAFICTHRFFFFYILLATSWQLVRPNWRENETHMHIMGY